MRKSVSKMDDINTINLIMYKCLEYKILDWLKIIDGYEFRMPSACSNSARRC